MVNPFAIWTLLTSFGLLAATFRSWRFFQDLPRLPIEESLTETVWPKITMIVPACNEAATIETAAQSLLEMDYPNLEIIFVDDRSTDETGAIIDKIAGEDPRVQAIHVAKLPSGWLGKIHALSKGVDRSTGEWILITDADVHYGRDCLKKAVTFTRERKLDFLTVLPDVHAESLLLRICILHFAHLLATFVPLSEMNDPRKNGFMGVGAFLFMHRTIYEKSKKLEWLRMEIIDDSAIALMIRNAGGVMGVVAGFDDLQLEWYPTFSAFVRGLEKNVFAGFQYSVPLLTAALIAQALVLGGILVAPWLAGSHWYPAVAIGALGIYAAAFAYYADRLTRVRKWEALLSPLGAFILPLIVLRAALLTLWRGGVQWRTSFYPLAELRANQRLKLSEFVIPGRRRTGTDAR